MLVTKYQSNLEKLSNEQIISLTQKIKEKDIESWHTFVGNVVRNSKDKDYRDVVKDTFKLVFKESREDEAMYVLDREDYEYIFPLILNSLYDFHEDDAEFIAITAHFYRDARFGYQDIEKTNELAQSAIAKNNPLGMTVMAYQYFFGTGITQDIDKAFDLADSAVLVSEDQSQLFCKAFLFFQRQNYDLSESILNTIPDDEGYDLNSAISTLRAELELQKGNTEKAIELLLKAIDYDQSSYPYFLLGRTFLYGANAIEADPEKGIAYLKQALEKGAAHAGLFLGYYYCYNAPEKDILEGEAYFKKAATYNNNDAKYELRKLHIYQENFDLSQKLQSLEALVELAENYPKAYVDVAYQYLAGTIVDKDLEKAHQFLEKSIAGKYAYAAYYLGREYEYGTFNKENNSAEYDKAFEWYTVGASLNGVESIEVLGRYYRLGIVGEPDPEKAIAFNKRGIESFNSNYSKVELAICYENGFGVERDYQQAFDLFLSAANNRDPYAMYQVGLYYRDGALTNGDSDFENSYKYFNAAYTNGYGLAFYELAKATYYGEGVVADVPKAIEMYHECLNNKIFDAAVDLGIYYEQNEEDNDPSKAVEYMKQAVEAEIPYSFYKLGSYYYAGFGVEENVDTAKMYFLRAVERRYQYANISLGNIELWEEASDSNDANAFEYYTTAAQYGYYNYGLGMCYKYGIGTEKNPEKAFEAFTEGSEQRSSTAVYHLAMCYLNGFGTTKNVEKAVENFNLIQEQDIEAKYQLAQLYISGEGVQKNETLGVAYLTQVAENNHADAQYMLGNMYLIGNAVEENETVAFDWFSKAAENGNEKAQKIVSPKPKRRSKLF